MRVVLLDHEIYRMGFRLVLETVPDCEVVGEANTAPAAFEVIRTFAPDVVVVDTVLRGLRTASALRKLRGCAPGVRILVLTEHGRIREVAAAMAAGVNGYALKGDSNDEILGAVHRVHLGRLYLSPTIVLGSDRRLDFRPVSTSQELAG